MLNQDYSHRPSVGFIGLGVMGHRMLTNMTAHGGFDLTRAWDPDSRARQVVQQQYPGVKICRTADDLIADAEVDVVYIASPPAFHRDYALAAAASGKAVYCEKPLGTDVESSRALVDAVEASGVPNAVNFPFADAQAINLIEAKMADGSVGEVTGVDVRLHFSSWPRDWQATARWLAYREQGGFVREVLSHYVYLVERLFGPAVLVDASVRYPDDPTLCETHFIARLSCGGCYVSLTGGSGSTGPDTVEFTLWGTRTSLRLWDWNRLKSATGDCWQDELKALQDPRQDGYMRMLNNVLRFLTGDAHTLPSFRAALSVQEIIESILAH